MLVLDFVQFFGVDGFETLELAFLVLFVELDMLVALEMLAGKKKED